MARVLAPGTAAPSFKLRVTPDQHLSLCDLVGKPVSVDGAWCPEAFSEDRHLHFPLLADFEPKGDVAKRYGAYRFDEGVCARALFVIDRKGTIFWSYLSPIAVNPGADGILDALEQLPVKVSS
jgi:peroxiredoxin